MSPPPLPIAVRWPISLKIFGISSALLVLMIFVTLLTTMNFRRVGEQLALLSDYYIELDQLMSDVRVESVREVVQIERLLHARPTQTPADGEARAAALAGEAGDCSPEPLRKVQLKMREEFKDRPARRLMGYRVNRLCTDLKLRRAAKLVGSVLALEQVRASAEQVERFTTIKSEIANIAPARAKLQASFEKSLLQFKAGDAQTIAVFQDRIDEHRADVNRRIGAVTRSLHAGTRESAEFAQNLEERTRWLSWALTLVACTLGLVFATIITRNLVRPVRDLLSMTGSIRSGNLDVQIRIKTADEIGQLADSFNHMVGELKEKESIEKMFGKYVDPRVVQNLLHGSKQFSDGGERQTMSVFFSDLEGFTTLSEGLTPTAMVRLLNRYFALMAEAIRAEQGIIDKYIGDSVMAFWGAPFCAPGREASLACYAALAQQAQMDGLRALLPEILGIRRNVPMINVRMGIATGDVTVGSIGSEDARSYTVIGDTVNLASRLEGANKVYGTRILVNEDTRRLAGEDIEVREIDAIRVVGKVEPTCVYELIGRRGEIAPKTAELRGHYERGLGLFRLRKWDEARAEFNACIAIDPADGPARLFVGRVASLETQVLPEAWDGVFLMTGK